VFVCLFAVRLLDDCLLVTQFVWYKEHGSKESIFVNFERIIVECFRCYSGVCLEELNEITKTYSWFPDRYANQVTMSIYEHNNVSETELLLKYVATN
jgi:hypothetical protein